MYSEYVYTTLYIANHQSGLFLVSTSPKAYMSMIEPQLPWLRTAIYHSDLDVKKENRPVRRTHFCQYQAVCIM